MSEKVVGGLRWVKGEIATTLRRITELVDAYGQTGEPAALDDTAQALCEVHGILRVLELPDPASLAAEMQQLCAAMANRQVQSPRDATEAMMLALIQLPNHLDQIDAAAPVAPFSLAHTINDLRQARGAAPLSVAQWQGPGSLSAEVAASTPPVDLEAISAMFREARPHFHRHLVDWYRPATGSDGLFKLGLLFYQVHRHVGGGVLADLFHLAEAFAVGLQGGKVVADAAARALIGRLDRVFKPLVASPPQWPGADAQQLIEAYLGALARAAIQTPLVAEIQSHYGWAAAPAGPPEGTSAALAVLALAMLGELAALKGRLDQFVHGVRDDRTPLEEIGLGLRNLARTLDVADAGPVTDRLRMLAEGFSELAMADAIDDALGLESLAAELLGIEAAMHAYAEHREPQMGEFSASEAYGAELQTATLREARAEFVYIKEAILDCQPHGAQPEAFRKVPDRLASVAGALRMLGQIPAAQAAEALGSLLRQGYLEPNRWPRGDEFELLADAIVALELHIELVKERQPEDPDLLPRARQAVGALDRMLGGDQPAVRSPRPMPVPLPGDPGSAPAPTPRSRSAAAPSGGITSEFLDVFLEEAEEEAQSIVAQFGRLRANPADNLALTTLRRSFHTLKGSGRMVGALRVADVAWAVEAVLNQLIEFNLRPGARLLHYVGEVIDLLPELLAAEAQGRPLDIAGIVSRAAQLDRPADEDRPDAADGTVESLPVAAAGSDLAPASAVPAAPAAGVAAPPGTQPPAVPALTDHASMFAADDELLEIFREETLEHLEVVRAFLARATPDTTVLGEDIIRALHTLSGSARMAGINSIADVAKALEQRLRILQTAQLHPDAPLLALLDRAADGIARRVTEIPAAGPAAADLIALAADLAGVAAPAVVAPPIVPPVAPPVAPCLSDGVARTSPPPPAAATVPPDGEGLVGCADEDQAAVPSVARRPDPGAATGDNELASLFLEEGRDLLDGLDAKMRAWQLAPQEVGVLDGVKRLLHTLKGGARLTGLHPIGDLSHALETRLTAIGVAGRVDETTLELAQQAVDTLSLQFDAWEQHAPVPGATALTQALSAPPQAITSGLAPTSDLATRSPIAAAQPPPTAVPGAPAAGRAGGAGDEATFTQVRVRSDLLNRLVDNAGEIGLYRARLTQYNTMLGFNLGELDQTVTRLREQLRQLEIETEAQILFRFEREGVPEAEGPVFDPLELDRFSTLQQLSRSLAETVNDLVSLRDVLGNHQRESMDLLTQQARLADDLQDGLLRTRMVPFVQVVPRLHRLVRQTADNLGKSARLTVLGPEVELDRVILNRLVAPLEHLLRNAVDHGLESSAGRVAVGKPATGTVTLELSREGNEVVIALGDDGHGLDLAAIRARAVARGLLAAQVEVQDAALMQFVFAPGFTTLERVTQISGRGVGLDVVASEIKAANGSIDLASSPGHGTRFTIRLPLTLAIVKALLVGVAGSVYAIPHATIEGAARISREDLTAIYQGTGRDFDYRGQPYRVAYLGALLDRRLQPDLSDSRWLPLLLTRVGDLRVALQVDHLIESARVVVKPLGAKLAALRWLAGGTILPDGRVALILDVLAVLRAGTLHEHLTPPLGASAPAAAAPAVCVMVVDDSLTVRRVTTRMLQNQNIEVVTAKDGVEALTLLDNRVPDLMLLDIEMPRMDGYEVTRHIRQSERLRALPIIMITSRTGAKHRDHAISLGVNRFLGKPYQESDLLDEIAALLAEQRP